jgi:hypothetical protein
MRILVLLPALLAACAVTPQDMAQRSNWDVCRFTMGGPWSQTAQYEAQRRSLDCSPYYGPINAQMQRENAATSEYLQSLQRRRPPPPQTINCQSYRVGNSVQTTCN